MKIKISIFYLIVVVSKMSFKRESKINGAVEMFLVLVTVSQS